jgi:hypothetical protein
LSAIERLNELVVLLDSPTSIPGNFEDEEDDFNSPEATGSDHRTDYLPYGVSESRFSSNDFLSKSATSKQTPPDSSSACSPPLNPALLVGYFSEESNENEGGESQLAALKTITGKVATSPEIFKSPSPSAFATSPPYNANFLSRSSTKSVNSARQSLSSAGASPLSLRPINIVSSRTLSTSSPKSQCGSPQANDRMERKRPLSPSTRANSSQASKRPKPGPFDYSSDSDDASSEDEAPKPSARPVQIAVPAVKSQKRLNLNLFKERMAKKPVNPVGSLGQLRQDNAQAEEATGLGATNSAMKPAQAKLGTGNVQSSKPSGAQGGQTIRSRPASLGSGKANTSINGRVATTGRLTEQISSRTPVTQVQAKRSAPNSSAPNTETYDRAPPLIQKHALSKKVSLSQVGIIDSVPASKNGPMPAKPSNPQLQQQRSGGTPALPSAAINKKLPSQIAKPAQEYAKASGHGTFQKATGTQQAQASVSTPVLRKSNTFSQAATAPLTTANLQSQQVSSSSKVSEDAQNIASQQARAILQKPPSGRLGQVHSNTGTANGRVGVPSQPINATPKTVTGPPQQSRGGLGAANGGNPSVSQQARSLLKPTNSRPQQVTDGQSTVNAANTSASQLTKMSSRMPSSPKQQPVDKSVNEEGTKPPATQLATNTRKTSGTVIQEVDKLPTPSAGQMDSATQPAKAPVKADGYPHHLQLFKNSTGASVGGSIKTTPATPPDIPIGTVEQVHLSKTQEKPEKPQHETQEKKPQTVGGLVESKHMEGPIAPLDPKDASKVVSLPIKIPGAKMPTKLGEGDENPELSLAEIHSQKKLVNYDSDSPPSAHSDGSPVKNSGPSSEHPSTTPPGTLQDIGRSHHPTEASQPSRDASVNPKLVPSTLGEVSKQPKEASAAEKEVIVPSAGAQHIELLKHFNFSPSHPGIAIPMDQMRFEVPTPASEPTISKPEIKKQEEIAEPMDMDIVVEAKPTAPTASTPTITNPTPQFTTLSIPHPSVINTCVTPSSETPFFTYHIYQTLSTSTPLSHSTTPIELTHPHTTLHSANTAAQTLIHSLQTYPSIYPITILSFHLTHDAFGCVSFEARFVSEGEPEVKRVHRIFVGRREVPEISGSEVVRDVGGVGTSVFAVRLGRVLEGGSMRDNSESDSDEDDDSSDNDSDNTDDADDEDKGSNRTLKHSPSNPSASKSCSKSQSKAQSIRNEIHTPLPPAFPPIHTTLTSANRLAMRLQIHLSHAGNPTNPMEKMWQEKDRRELQMKIEGLEQEGRECKGEGDKGGYWMSEFNGAGKGGERFVLRVERVGLVGPRNI